jgi:hypothetical protein
VGCIDGCHIPISAPVGEHKAAYINRKGFFSVNLQGVCDSERLFTDVYIGEVGSVHDATVFKRSDLYEKMMSGELGLNEHQHIIGDKAYPISSFLLVPYRQIGQVCERKKRFNKRLSKSRMKIECAFGLLKGRFRRLRYLEMRKKELIPLVVFASCVLHNICILNDDWEWVNADVDNDDDDGLDQAAINDLNNAPLQKRRGEEKRDFFARQFR